ncbi:MAG TPA: helix-turn-helix domain-containing protein [Terriglobia bacterium]|nr:helix-turn-helix domain-containing protein [Terriglobia bacterium]
MAKLDAAKVIRKVRTRLGVSQEGLSRRLNATKGAVQHWERGRNHPDLARLEALRNFCPAGPERRQLDALIKDTQGRIALPPGEVFSGGGATQLQKENGRLRGQVTRLETALQRKTEECHILKSQLMKEMVSDVQRQLAELVSGKGGQS